MDSEEKVFCPRCGVKGTRSLQSLSEKNPQFAKPRYDRRLLAMHCVSIALLFAGWYTSKIGMSEELSIALLAIGFITFVVFKDTKFARRKLKWEHAFYCSKCKQISVVDKLE